MATTTPTDASQNVAGPQVVKPGSKGKNPGGRPQKWEKVPVSKKTSEVSEETFWEWLDRIPKDAWANRYICYVWRTAPIIDLSGGGKAVTIEKICRPFDSQEILRSHGSGGYRFDVCERNVDGTEQKRLRQAYETVMDMRYPPKVALGEWVDHPQNKNWQWAIPELQAQEAKRAAPAAPEAQPSVVEQLNDVVDLAQKLNPPKKEEGSLNVELIKLITATSDPSKRLQDLKTLQELMPRSPDTSNTTDKLLLLLINKMFDKPEQPDMLTTAMTLMGKVKEFFGRELGGGGAAKLDASTAVITAVTEVGGKVVEGLASHIPDILNTIRMGKTLEFQMRQLEMQRAQPQPTNWNYQPPPVPQQAQPQPQPLNPEVVVPPISKGPMLLPVFFAKYKEVLGKHFASIQSMFKRSLLPEGDPNFDDGISLQRELIHDEGRVWFDEFRKDARIELLVQMVGMSPDLQKIFTPPEKVQTFFEEVLSDPDEEGEDDEETEGGVTQ